MEYILVIKFGTNRLLRALPFPMETKELTERLSQFGEAVYIIKATEVDGGYDSDLFTVEYTDKGWFAKLK